jgi:predicted nucleotidyltransferase component of viral defense system
MIDRGEILTKAEEFDLHPSNVQRDYVFGWLLAGLFRDESLGQGVALKGGNGLRKAYLPSTRFSDDLDFTTSGGLDGEALVTQFNEICCWAQRMCGVQFDTARNKLADEHQIDRARTVYKLRLYFQDFSGDASQITLKVRVDVTEYDRILLPVQQRTLIHPYSDSGECATSMQVVKLEEVLADKLKCLLQRRHSHDLFDLVHGVFVQRGVELDRRELVQTFLRKTIFEPSPTTARSLLLATPFEAMRGFWQRLRAPKPTRLSFDQAVSAVKDGLATLFAPFAYGDALAAAYYPAKWRNPILQGGSDLTLVRVTYDGVEREVEPYSLAFKRRRDGVAQEYFYGWDLTGGRVSGPGIKTFLQGAVQDVQNTDVRFDPRFEVELSKAGDREGEGFFGRTFAAQAMAGMRKRGRWARV